MIYHYNFIKIYLVFGNPDLSRLFIFTPAVYPHLMVNYDFNYFSLLKSANSTYRIGEANRFKGSYVMIGQTKKQTDRQTEITTLYIYKI